MTKTQTEQAAKNAADLNAEITKATAFDLEKTDWQTRRNTAVEHAKLAVNLNDVDVKWSNAYMEAYADRVMTIWGIKLKQLENARRNFKAATNSMTPSQAQDKIVALANSFNFRGSRVDGHSLEIKRGDHHGGSLYWSFDTNHDHAVVINPDDKTQRAYPVALSLKISTSGTTYTLAAMTLVHKIHAELLEAAAEIEATFAREQIFSVYGVEEAK